MTAHSELATALAFVLQKWKDTGADPVETAPFDELLARTKDEMPPQIASPPPAVSVAEPVTPAPKRRNFTADKLAVLDAEIEAANREAGG